MTAKRVFSKPMYIIARLVINALALMLVAYVIPGVTVNSFLMALLAAIIIGLVNALIRPVLEILSLPVTILTLGLFSLVINALMFWLASAIAPGFSVSGFGPAFWGGLVFSVIGWATNIAVFDRKKK